MCIFRSKNIDRHLTNNGVISATKIYNTWNEQKDVEAIFVSPLIRTLETVECIYRKYPNVVLDIVLEFPLGSHATNFRSCKTLLQHQFPYFDFSNLSEFQKNTRYRRDI